MADRPFGVAISRLHRKRFPTVTLAGGIGLAAALLPAPALGATEPLAEPRLGLGLLLILSLIAINAFFVAAEFAMVSVRRSQIDRLVESGDTQARTVQILKRDIDLLLSSTQLGITLSSLALGWTSEQTMAKLVVWPIRRLPWEVVREPALAHAIAVPIAFAFVAYLQIVLGELCPKSLALLYPEQLARFFGPPSLAIARCFSPFLWAINHSTRFLLRTFGIRLSTLTAYNHVTSEELQQIISKDGEVTGLEADEREWLSNIFEFGDVTVSEIMTPRTQICAIHSNASLGEFLEEVATTCHSHYPAIGESLDDVRGVVSMKDLAEPLAADDRRDAPIANWIAAVRFVPEYTPIAELMPLLQRSSHTLVMVVDEFGGTAGLVTLQDAIEEIFGDSLPPDPSEEPSIEFIDERTFSVRAQLHVEEVNDALDLDLPTAEDYQTLAGLLIFYMQKIPEIGEKFRLDDLELVVRSADGPRLDRIYIQQIDPEPVSNAKPMPLPDLEDISTESGEETGELSPDVIAELTNATLEAASPASGSLAASIASDSLVADDAPDAKPEDSLRSVSENAIHELRDAQMLDTPMEGMPPDWTDDDRA